MSDLRRWSLLVLLVGREAQGEVLEQARKVVRYLLGTVARQSEVHTSQKLRRALQLYSAYCRLWGEEVRQGIEEKRAGNTDPLHYSLIHVFLTLTNMQKEIFRTYIISLLYVNYVHYLKLHI